MPPFLIYLSCAFAIKFLYDMVTDENPISEFKKLNLKDREHEKEYDRYRIDKVNYTNYGFEMIIECLRKGHFEELENLTPVFNKLYKCKTFVRNIENSHNVAIYIVRKYSDIPYKPSKLTPYELLIGYDYKDTAITVNMKITPHIAVVGISNNGKTKCVETMLNNLSGCTIDILNSMDNDFMNFADRKINGEDNIIDYLYHISHGEEILEKPHYIVIDEYNVLSHLKSFDDILCDLLRQARHRNIFIILIAQQLQLEYCPFRDLFNARLCFRQLNKHAIFSFIGQSVDNTDLKQREFILLHQKLEYGKSYKIM